MRKILATLAIGTITTAACTSPKTPETPNCSSINLLEKVGFSTKFGPEKESICYRIPSGAGRFYEYIGLCEPVGGTMQVYRDFAGPNKGEMEINYVVDFLNSHAYVPVWRSPSGKLSGFLPDTPEKLEKVKENFNTGAKLLDSVKNIPQVCKELQEYKKK